ncbi:MAG TPA: hypothetical protein PLD02_13925 [Saprospiraceae bacterium]|nr:hypothetical protein [Saprospiraceae bacterium]
MNKPPTFNGNNSSFVSSMTGGFPPHNGMNQMPNQSYMYPPNTLANSNVSLPISQPPLTFNHFQMGYNNQIQNNASFGNQSISPQMINLSNPAPINLVQ